MGFRILPPQLRGGDVGSVVDWCSPGRMEAVMVRGFLKLAAVASVCATVAMLGGFASTKGGAATDSFSANLGGSSYVCKTASANAIGSILTYNCSNSGGGAQRDVCMKDSWAGDTWSRNYRSGACDTNTSAPWTFVKSWSGVL